MPLPIERCCFCQQALEGRDHKETIYVRVSRSGGWGSEACCTPCWTRDNPGQEPVRFLRKKLHDEEGEA